MDIDGIRNALLYIDDVRSVDLAEKKCVRKKPFCCLLRTHSFYTLLLMTPVETILISTPLPPVSAVCGTVVTAEAETDAAPTPNAATDAYCSLICLYRSSFTDGFPKISSNEAV